MRRRRCPASPCPKAWRPRSCEACRRRCCRGAAVRERRVRGPRNGSEPGGDRRRCDAAQTLRIRGVPRGHERAGRRAARLYAAHTLVQRLCAEAAVDLGTAGQAGDAGGRRPYRLSGRQHDRQELWLARTEWRPSGRDAPAPPPRRRLDRAALYLGCRRQGCHAGNRRAPRAGDIQGAGRRDAQHPVRSAEQESVQGMPQQGGRDRPDRPQGGEYRFR